MAAEQTETSQSAPIARFHAGGRVRGISGGGALVITPGSIALETARMTRVFSGVARVVHSSPQVMLVKARLVPPWYNTSVVLHDGELVAYATVGQWARSALRAALAAAGFEVREVSTWFSLAGSREVGALVRRRERGELRRRLGPVGLVVQVVGIGVWAVAVVLIISQSPLFIALVAVFAALSVLAVFRR